MILPATWATALNSSGDGSGSTSEGTPRNVAPFDTRPFRRYLHSSPKFFSNHGTTLGNDINNVAETRNQGRAPHTGRRCGAVR